MSRIDELIQPLCPDGVEYKPLGEIFDTRNGYTPSKAQEKYWENGTIPWFRMEDIRLHGRILSDSIQHISRCAIKGGKLFPANSIILGTTATIGEHALVTVECLSNQQMTNLAIKKEYSSVLNIKFFFYYCFVLGKWCRRNINAGNFALLDISKLKKRLIPVPPLPVQEEIVRILDKFTALEAELEAELEARRKQYEYYRDQLLTFSDEVKWKPLGEIGTFVRGNGLQKKDFVDHGVGCIHYGQIYTYYKTVATETKSFVTKELALHLTQVYPNDLIIACTSENIEDVCKTVAWLGKETIVTGGHACVFRHKQNAKYLAYFLSTDSFFRQKKKFARGAKVIDIKTDDLAKIRIPVPPLAEQERIVRILDKFDALVNDISSGLPAELEMRRKQYEYYRDKLLTFKPIAKEA